MRFFKEEWRTKTTQLLFLLCLGYAIWVSSPFGIAPICLSSFMFGLVTCVYMLRVFGVFETSVRLRLMDLLVVKKGKTLENILEEFNSKSILDSRLKRLLLSKTVKYDGRSYSLAKRNNAYSLFEAGVRVLRKLINFSL